jgi:hypothetical protein
MPDTTMSGSRSNRPVIATWTQSVGVPSTAVETVVVAGDVKRVLEAERVAGAAAVAVGRHYRYLRQFAEGSHQAEQAGRQITVVVTDQNMHDYKFSRAAHGAVVRMISGGADVKMVVFQIWISYQNPKFISVDKEANNDVMHFVEFGETNRLSD